MKSPRLGSRTNPSFDSPNLLSTFLSRAKCRLFCILLSDSYVDCGLHPFLMPANTKSRFSALRQGENRREVNANAVWINKTQGQSVFGDCIANLKGRIVAITINILDLCTRKSFGDTFLQGFNLF